MANTNRKFLKFKALSPIRIKKMRVDAWVKPFFAITYKANNAQGIIPFGISQQPVMAVREKNHLGRGLNLGWQAGNLCIWGPGRFFSVVRYGNPPAHFPDEQKKNAPLYIVYCPTCPNRQPGVNLPVKLGP